MTQRGSRSTQKQMPPRILREVLDRQPQPARARGPEHQPVRAFREVLVRQRRAEQLVVGAEVVERDARLRNAGRAAGLEHVDRLAGEPLRDPALHRTAAQPLVLERAEARRDRRTRRSPAADPIRASSRSRARTDDPVAGSKCQLTISRTCASSAVAPPAACRGSMSRRRVVMRPQYSRASRARWR